MNILLDNYQKGNPFYLYTGRGPSNNQNGMHCGHLLPFQFTKYLQDVFNTPLVVQMSDDEKYYFKDIEFDEVYKNTFENAKDIIACGFNSDKTFIFSDLDYMGYMYKNVVKLDKSVMCNQIKGLFGLQMTGDTSCILAKLGGPQSKLLHVFQTHFLIFLGKKDVQCLIRCAIDQSPYFRMVRDYSDKLGYKKPALLYNQFLVSLAGPNQKMSSSDVGTHTIFLTDTPEMIKNKITKNAFSGGRATLKEHKELGANLEIDVPINI